jgi:hypothetical protein
MPPGCFARYQPTKQEIKMHQITRTLALFGFAIVAGNLWAADSAIQGTVKDANGRPISHADIRIEARGGSSWHQVVKTDANGRYSYNSLKAGGTYRVSLLVNSVVQASINNVPGKAGDTTQLNFDMRKSSVAQGGAPAKKKHMVWVPAETGSNLGGRWVDVDAGGTVAPSANNVTRTGAGAIATMTSNGGHSTGGN